MRGNAINNSAIELMPRYGPVSSQRQKHLDHLLRHVHPSRWLTPLSARQESGVTPGVTSTAAAVPGSARGFQETCPSLSTKAVLH